MSKLEIFVSLSAYSVVPVVYSFVLGCLFVLKYVVMCIDGVGWNMTCLYPVGHGPLSGLEEQK